jgi:hypothetical protein
MRFLHAKTIQLREFPENELPPYAILSHTWEREEVSFQDMQDSNAAHKEGYAKIKIRVRPSYKGRFRICLGRYLLYRYAQQFRTFRGYQLNVLLVSERTDLLCLPS